MAKGHFSVFFPNAKPTIGKRYFFFVSLWGKHNRIGFQSSGVKLAEKVKELERKNIENKMNNKSKQREGLTIVQQSLQFLHSMIEHERKQEFKFFEANIQKNPKISEEMKNGLKKFFTLENDKIMEVDYLGFINWINNFYSGSENYLAILKDELNRLNELSAIMGSLKAAATRIAKSRKRKYKEIPNFNNEAINELFSNFLLKKIKSEKNIENAFTMEKVAKATDSKTLLDRIQNEFEETFNKVWNSDELRAKINDLILEKNDSEALKEETVAFLLANFMSTFPKRINKILKENLPDDEELPVKPDYIKKIAEDFVKSLDLKDLSEASFEYEELVLLLNRAKTIQKSEAASEAVKKKLAFRKNIGISSNSIKGSNRGESGKKQGGIEGLTQDMIDFLTPVIEKMKKENQAAAKRIDKFRGTKKFAASTQRDILMRELAELRPSIKVMRNKTLYYDYTEMEKFIKELINSREVISVKIKEKNGFFSGVRGTEGIIQGLLKSKEFARNIANVFGGSKDAEKNIIAIEQVVIKNNLHKTDIAKFPFFSKIRDTFIVTNKLITNRKVSTKTYNEDEEREKAGFSKDELFFEGETKRRILAWEKTFKEVQEELKKEQIDLKNSQKILSGIKNSFEILPVIENDNYYDNNLGFRAPSIGATLEHQLDNIDTMFRAGGITPLDRDWLLFAIYNSGRGMIGGEELKNRIENLLSTVAVMLLFKDSGQQAHYIATQAQKHYSMPSVNSLHLYYLNGIYFPGSYILQLTYDSLVRAELQLEVDAEIFSSGSRANIINNVNQLDDMVGEEGSDGIKRVTSPQDWYDTFENAKDKVNIQITYLAGFLDILEQLREKMRSVKIQ